ncbi:hypothetical protein Cus16_1169 [Curtobacterium sp. ER1/6]|nr:hypothetical protein Cus16_1169 [Curtobacterium sp. ER1/6]
MCAHPGTRPSTTSVQPSSGRLPARTNQSSFAIPGSAVRGEAEVDATVHGGVEPPRGDRLLPGEEAHAVRAVRLVVAEQRVPPATERVVRDRHRDRDVDADHADLHVPLEPAGGTAVVREDRRAVAEGAGVDELEPLLVGLHADDRQHRAEDLLGVDATRRRHPVDQRRTEPEAVLVAVGSDGAAVHHDLRTVLLGDLDVRGDLVAVLLGDERAHVAAPASVADAQRRRALADLRDEVVRHGLDGDDDRDRHAALTGRAEARVDRVVGDEVEVGVGQHEHVVLRAAEGLHALAVLRPRLVHVLRDRGRPDERDRLDVRAGEEAVDGLLVAVEHREDAVGQSCLPELLREPDRRARVLLARLEHDGVAGRDRDRQEPQRHHGREVERRDDADDAERLADRVDVDAGRHLVGELALHQRGDARRELHDLLPAGDLAERVRGDLAVLARDDLGELGLVAVEDLAEREEDLLALRERHLAPGRERGLRARDRPLDLGLVGQGDPLGHDAERGVVHRGRPARGRRDVLAVDPVPDRCESLLGGWLFRGGHALLPSGTDVSRVVDVAGDPGRSRAGVEDSPRASRLWTREDATSTAVATSPSWG